MLPGTATMDNIVTAFQCAQVAVEAYTDASGSHAITSRDIVDLVTDLMHFAQAWDLEPASIIAQAQEHFSVESALARNLAKVASL
jgi:hypothetical protein